MSPDASTGSGEAHESSFHPSAWIVGQPEIGPGTWIGAFCVVDASGGLTIGAGCDIASGAHIYTHSSALRCISGRSYDTVDRAPVSIGENVFIGANAVVQMGVTVGAESVVAAGAVVTRDVAARTVVAGNPARPVGRVDLSDPTRPRTVRQ